MERSKNNLDLEYINNRVNRLIKRFNKFERLVYSWKNQDMEEIDNLKKEKK